MGQTYCPARSAVMGVINLAVCRRQSFCSSVNLGHDGVRLASAFSERLLPSKLIPLRICACSEMRSSCDPVEAH